MSTRFSQRVAYSNKGCGKMQPGGAKEGRRRYEGTARQNLVKDEQFYAK